MMDEVHQEEDFLIDGPLWIQVQALEKGLEVLVTKAQISKDGQKFELPIPEGKFREFSQDDKIGDLLGHHFSTAGSINTYEGDLDFLLVFNDFEDIIALSKETVLDSLSTKLYSFENRYYLYVVFPDNKFDEEEIDDYLSILLGIWGNEANATIHRVEEYGKEIYLNMFLNRSENTLVKNTDFSPEIGVCFYIAATV